MTYDESVTAATYAPPVTAHPDRVGPVKTAGPNKLIVIHTSEGSEGPLSATNLAKFIASPGDRGVEPNRYGASYHYVTDITRAIPIVPHNRVAYAAAGANHNGIHICIPGRVAQTREQWLDPVSRGYIRTAAAVAVDVAATERIPLIKLAIDLVQAGRSGICGHHDVSMAFGRSDHTDPEPNFPWDIFLADIASFATPQPPEPPEDTMELFVIADADGTVEPPRPMFARVGHLVSHVKPAQWAAMGHPAAAATLKRADCIRYTFVGEPPDDARGIWANA